MPETNEGRKERCFVIMPISDQGDYPTGHFTKVYEQIIKPSVEEAGYEAYRVDEDHICTRIINDIFSSIQECPMAICDLSNSNPNVLYELGLRQAYDKPVVLIQDEKTERIFDIAEIRTVSYKSSRRYEEVLEAKEEIKKAILATREGKTSTLAKIIKVNAADYSQVEVSKDDKTNIVLEGIYNEIRGLKNTGHENDNMEIFHSVHLGNKCCGIKLKILCEDSKLTKDFKEELFNNRQEREFIKINKAEDNILEVYIHNITKINVEKRLRFYIEIAQSLNLEVLDYNFI